MDAAPAPPPAPAAVQQSLTPAQLEAQLWADDRQHVFAVVMGSRIPDLPQLLAAADVVDHDCLLPGALTRQQQEQAPYLVQLRRGAPFTGWLLFQAASGLPDWGVLALSTAAPLALRGHLRALAEARLPDGNVIDLEWMDPVVLRALLPHFDAGALRSVMGPVQALVFPAAARWSRVELVMGALQWQEVNVAAGA